MPQKPKTTHQRIQDSVQEYRQYPEMASSFSDDVRPAGALSQDEGVHALVPQRNGYYWPLGLQPLMMNTMGKQGKPFDPIAAGGKPVFDPVAAGGTLVEEPKPTLAQQASETMARVKGAPDERGWLEVMGDQSGKVVEGIPKAIIGIPGMVGDVGSAIWQTLTGGGTSKGQEMIGGMLAPVTTSARGLGALVEQHITRNGEYSDTPGLAPSREEWEGAAEGAGANFGGIGIGAGLAGAGPLARTGAGKLPTPESLMVRSMANRARAAQPLAQLPTTTAMALKSAPKFYGAVAAPVQEALAKRMAGSRVTSPVTPTLTDADIRALPMSETPPSMEVPRSRASMDQFRNRPPITEALDQSTTGVAPKPFQSITGADTEAFLDRSTSRNRFNDIQAASADEARRAASWPAPEELIDQSPTGILPKQFAPPLNDTQAFLDQATLDRMAPSASLDVTGVEQALAPTGMRNKISVLRNTQKLLEEVPELRIQDGVPFDTKIMDAFRRSEQRITATEDAIPDTTTVSKGPILDHFKQLATEYQERGLTRAEASVTKLTELWERLPDAIPWDQFLLLKRNFFKQANPNSVPMKRAYGGLMESTSKISTDLAKANGSYRTIRQALDAAAIDPVTGRRIKAVGQIPKGTLAERAQETMRRKRP